MKANIKAIIISFTLLIAPCHPSENNEKKFVHSIQGIEIKTKKTKDDRSLFPDIEDQLKVWQQFYNSFNHKLKESNKSFTIFGRSEKFQLLGDLFKMAADYVCYNDESCHKKAKVPMDLEGNPLPLTLADYQYNMLNLADSVRPHKKNSTVPLKQSEYPLAVPGSNLGINLAMLIIPGGAFSYRTALKAIFKYNVFPAAFSLELAHFPHGKSPDTPYLFLQHDTGHAIVFYRQFYDQNQLLFNFLKEIYNKYEENSFVVSILYHFLHEGPDGLLIYEGLDEETQIQKLLETKNFDKKEVLKLVGKVFHIANKTMMEEKANNPDPLTKLHENPVGILNHLAPHIKFISVKMIEQCTLENQKNTKSTLDQKVLEIVYENKKNEKLTECVAIPVEYVTSEKVNLQTQQKTYINFFRILDKFYQDSDEIRISNQETVKYGELKQHPFKLDLPDYEVEVRDLVDFVRYVWKKDLKKEEDPFNNEHYPNKESILKRFDELFSWFSEVVLQNE
jgi:hypothetical protein